MHSLVCSQRVLQVQFARLDVCRMFSKRCLKLLLLCFKYVYSYLLNFNLKQVRFFSKVLLYCQFVPKYQQQRRIYHNTRICATSTCLKFRLFCHRHGCSVAYHRMRAGQSEKHVRYSTHPTFRHEFKCTSTAKIIQYKEIVITQVLQKVF